jgi:hypothetical protein
VIARWTAGLLLLAVGCGSEPARSEVAALLRASSELRLGAPHTEAEVQAWGARHGLPRCDVYGWTYDEIGVGYGGCAAEPVVLDGGDLRFVFQLRREQWSGHHELFLTGFLLVQADVELMDSDGRRPDGLVPRATREVWGAPAATCDGLSVWVLPDRTAFLSASHGGHEEPALMVEAPPRIDGRALDCLSSRGQSPTRTKGAQ